jgi:hypothetical protein
VQPLISYSLGSYAGRLAGFWFLAGIGFVIAFVVYGLLVHPRFRRAQYRGRRMRPLAGLLTALPVFLAVAGTGYWVNFQGFFAVAVFPDQLRISYRFPDRDVTIRADELETIGEALTLAKTDERCIVLSLTTGQQHESVALPGRDEVRLLRDLRDWLAKARQ